MTCELIATPSCNADATVEIEHGPCWTRCYCRVHADEILAVYARRGAGLPRTTILTGQLPLL